MCTSKPDHFSGYFWHSSWRSTRSTYRQHTCAQPWENLHYDHQDWWPTATFESWLCEKSHSGSMLALLPHWYFEKKLQDVASNKSLWHTPGFPYGRFSPLDFDLTWKEVRTSIRFPGTLDKSISVLTTRKVFWIEFGTTTHQQPMRSSVLALLVHSLSNILSSRIVASISTGSIVTYFEVALKSCLEHPGWVCVCVPSQKK